MVSSTISAINNNKIRLDPREQFAKINELKTVEVWGTGNVKREFLHVDDLADAILFLLKKKTRNDFVNVGGGGYI